MARPYCPAIKVSATAASELILDITHRVTIRSDIQHMLPPAAFAVWRLGPRAASAAWLGGMLP